MAPKGERWDRAVEQWRALATDDGAEFDRSLEVRRRRGRADRDLGHKPAGTAPITGAVPDLESFAELGRSAARRALDYMGLAPGQRLLDVRNRACLHRQLHQQPDRGPAGSGKSSHRPQAERPDKAGPGRARVRSRQATGRGGRARPDLHRGWVRVARAGLLDVPCDESGQGAAQESVAHRLQTGISSGARALARAPI